MSIFWTWMGLGDNAPKVETPYGSTIDKGQIIKNY